MKSMTAYGRGEYEQGNRVFVAELKSLNNRYRDVVLRLPKALQGLEDDIRSQISSRVRRGRVEVSIQADKKGEEMNYKLELNLPLVNSYIKIFKQLEEEFGIEEKIKPDSLCAMRDVILMKADELDLDESREGVQKAIGLALDSLDSMRLREGEAIEKDFLKRLSLIEEYIDRVEERSPIVVEEYKQKLKARIDNISDNIEVDESRLAQEVAVFSIRSDITEEIVRARSHFNQFRNYMAKDGSIGRRLDFLIQEINREVNTISSKASDSAISANAVEIKAELEKLREQIQNVE